MTSRSDLIYNAAASDGQVEYLEDLINKIFYELADTGGVTKKTIDEIAEVLRIRSVRLLKQKMGHE